MRDRGRFFAAAGLTSLFVIVGGLAQEPPPPPAESRLADAIRKNTRECKLSGGALSGPGADFLLDAAAGAQFVLLGEEHNVREIPILTTILFRMLHARYGFDFLALETDPVMARAASQRPVRGDTNALLDFHRRYPNAFTFDTDQELSMIADVAAASTAKGRPIWGLDQVFGALHVVDRLIELAPNAAARERLRRLSGQIRPHETARFREGDRYLLDTPKGPDFDALADMFRGARNREAEFLAEQLLLSERVYRNWKMGASGTGYESNREREENMKTLFLTEYRAAETAGDRLPRVLVKMGHWHLYEGIGPAQIPTLGDFLVAFARAHDSSALDVALLLVGSPGSFRTISGIEWMKPLADAVPSDRSSVVDLRALRGIAYSMKPPALDPQLKRMILGFDLAVLLAGTQPGTRERAAAK